MNIINFKQKAESLISELENLAKGYLSSNGDTSEDCQRLCILNALKEVQFAINGTTEADLKRFEPSFDDYQDIMWGIFNQGEISGELEDGTVWKLEISHEGNLIDDDDSIYSICGEYLQNSLENKRAYGSFEVDGTDYKWEIVFD